MKPTAHHDILTLCVEFIDDDTTNILIYLAHKRSSEVTRTSWERQSRHASCSFCRRALILGQDHSSPPNYTRAPEAHPALQRQIGNLRRSAPHRPAGRTYSDAAFLRP